MLHDRDTVAAQALRSAGVESTTVRVAIVQLLGGPQHPRKPPRPLPSYISVGPLGRAILGLCAFLSSLAFGACAVGLAVGPAALGRPPAPWGVVLVLCRNRRSCGCFDLHAASCDYLLGRRRTG